MTVNHSVNFVDPSTVFSQYCIRKLYLNDSTDPFTRFLEIITKVYNPESIKSDFITITPAMTTKEPTKKPRVALVDLPQNPNNSLDDFQI